MKKFMAIILVFILVTGLLGGCSGTSSNTTPTQAPTGNATDTPTVDTTNAIPASEAYGSVDPADQLDYINYDGPVPIVKDGQKIDIKFGVWLETGFPNNVKDNWLWDFTADALNINPIVEQILDTEKLNLLFASNQVPDIMLNVSLSPSQQVMYGVSEKQLLSYEPYLESYIPSLKAAYDADPQIKPNFIASGEGDIFAFPRIMSDSTVVGSYIRQSWLDALNLEAPTTIDEYTNVMIAFRDAGPEFLGVEKVIPIGGGYDSEWANPIGVLSEAYGYQQNPYWKGWQIAAGYLPSLRVDDNGVADYGLPVYDEIFADFLAVQNMWYNENLYSTEYFTMDANQMRADTAAGYVGWQNTTEAAADTAGYFENEHGVTGGLQEWRTLGPLTSEFNSTPISTNYPIYNNSAFYIGASTKYPEVCARWIDLQYNTDWDFIVKNGPIEGISDSYGYKYYKWGINELTTTGLEGLYFEGEEVHNTYKNTYLVPTYMDKAFQTFDYTARWHSAVAGKTIEPNSVASIVATQKAQYEEDPVKYANHAFHIHKYDVRGAYSEHGVYAPLRFVYRDAETNQIIADLDAVLAPYIREQVALFISGKRPLSEVKSFQDELKTMGIEEYEAILAKEYADFVAKSGN